MVARGKEVALIRMLIPLIIIFLAYLLARTFMNNNSEPPIDVDPIDPSTDKTRKDDDDIIDVEPIVE